MLLQDTEFLLQVAGHPWLVLQSPGGLVGWQEALHSLQIVPVVFESG